MRVFSLVFFKLLLVPLAFAQGHAWLKGKWEKSPLWVSAFEKEIRSIWVADKSDEARLHRICEKAAKEFAKGGRDRAIALTKFAIIDAYFPSTYYRYNVDLPYLLPQTKIPHCYETARAHFVVMTRYGSIDPMWNMVDKFLEIWPKDPIIKTLIIRYYGFGADKIIPLNTLDTFMKEVWDDFPKKDEVILYYATWHEVSMYFRKKDKARLRKGIEHGEKYLAHSEVPEDRKKIMRTFLAAYRPHLKK